jgi:hypothetical protein
MRAEGEGIHPSAGGVRLLPFLPFAQYGGLVHRKLAGLGLLLATEMLAVLVLVRLGRAEPFAIPLRFDAWAHATPEDALAATARWVALATCVWLLVVTVAYACVAGRAPSRSGRRWIPAAIRRVVDGAVAASVAVAVVAMPPAANAGTRDQPPAVTLVREGRAGDGQAGDLRSLPTDQSSAPASTTTTTTTTVTSSPVFPTPSAPRAPAAVVAPAPLASRTVAVEPGDNLWELAAREVARVQGVARGSVRDVDVARYWVAVCDVNRDRLRSRDVNLVYPGELVELPPA